MLTLTDYYEHIDSNPNKILIKVTSTTKSTRYSIAENLRHAHSRYSCGTWKIEEVDEEEFLNCSDKVTFTVPELIEYGWIARSGNTPYSIFTKANKVLVFKSGDERLKIK